MQVHDDRNILYVEYFKVFVQTLLAHILFSYVALICCSKQQLQQHVFTKKPRTNVCIIM